MGIWGWSKNRLGNYPEHALIFNLEHTAPNKPKQKPKNKTKHKQKLFWLSEKLMQFVFFLQLVSTSLNFRNVQCLQILHVTLNVLAVPPELSWKKALIDRLKVLLRKGQLALPVFYFPPSLLTLLSWPRGSPWLVPIAFCEDPETMGLSHWLDSLDETRSWPRKSAPPPYLVHIWLPCLCPTIHSNSHHQLPESVHAQCFLTRRNSHLLSFETEAFPA